MSTNDLDFDTFDDGDDEQDLEPRNIFDTLFDDPYQELDEEYDEDEPEEHPLKSRAARKRQRPRDD